MPCLTLKQDSSSNSFQDQKSESSDNPEGKHETQPTQATLYTNLSSKAGDIVKFLNKQLEIQRRTTFGAQKAPLGPARLRFVEMFMYITKLNANNVILKFAEEGIYKTLMV